jgi:hypothetical protein
MNIVFKHLYFMLFPQVRDKAFDKEDNVADGQTSLYYSAYACGTFDENIRTKVSIFWNFELCIALS